MTVQTSGYTGPIKHSVTVHTNDPVNPKVSLLVTATVEKEIIAIPPYVVLDGKQQEGDIVKTVKLKNVSDKPIELKSAQSPSNFVEAALNTDKIQPGEMAELTVRILMDRIKNSKLPQNFLNTVVRINTDVPHFPFINIWIRGPLKPVKPVQN